jgi:hypothetical protein
MDEMYENPEIQTTLTVNCIASNTFATCVQNKLFQRTNEILQITLMSIFIPKLQVSEIQALILVYPV